MQKDGRKKKRDSFLKEESSKNAKKEESWLTEKSYQQLSWVKMRRDYLQLRQNFLNASRKPFTR